MTRPAPPGAAVEAATWVPVRSVPVRLGSAGLSGGFTRRANSVLPWSPAAGVASARTAGVDVVDVGSALDEVEALYRTAGQAAVLRVPVGTGFPGAGAPTVAGGSPLGAELGRRGYRAVARTEVLVRDLDPAAGPPAGHGHSGDSDDQRDDHSDDLDPALTVQVSAEPDATWLDGWLSVKAAGRPVDLGLARAILTGSPAAYLSVCGPGGVSAVLRAAWAPGWVGLSCLMVTPHARRRGLGCALTRHALCLAADRGLGRAFLQVEVTNAAARELYRRLGFELADEYAYAER